MSKANQSLDARLRSLDKALAKAKKLNGRKISFEPMLEVLGVSRPVLRDWCNEIPGFADSGAFVKGDKGIAWEFKPVATVRFLIKHFQAERNKRQNAAAKVRRAIGGSELEGAPADMDLAEIKRALEVRSELVRQRREEGRLVDREVAERAFNEAFSAMQQAGVQAGREQDPTGRWPVEYREAWENAMDGIMLRMEQAAASALNVIRGRAT